MANLSFIERQRFNLVEGKVKENGQMFTLAVHRVEWFSAGVSSSQNRGVGIGKPIKKPRESSRPGLSKLLGNTKNKTKDSDGGLEVFGLCKLNRLMKCKVHGSTEDRSTEALLQILYGQYLILGVFGSCMFQTQKPSPILCVKT